MEREPRKRTDTRSQAVTQYQSIIDTANLDRMTAHRWQVISHIAEAMVRAAWKAGGLLREVERGKPGPHKDRSQTVTYFGDVLKLAKLDHMTAHRWQVISHIPEDRLEQFFCPDRKFNFIEGKYSPPKGFVTAPSRLCRRQRGIR